MPRAPPTIPRVPRPIRIIVVPSQQFRRPPRGVYKAGAVVVCMDVAGAPVRTMGTSEMLPIHNICALAVAYVLQMIDLRQEAIISTPLAYIEEKLRVWPTIPPWKRFTSKAGLALEAAYQLLQSRPRARIVTTATSSAADFDPRISPALINPDPERWWHQGPKGLYRDLAGFAAMGLPSVPRVVPGPAAPCRLLFTNQAATENRDGKLSRWIFHSYDHQGDALFHPEGLRWKK